MKPLKLPKAKPYTRAELVARLENVEARETTLLGKYDEVCTENEALQSLVSVAADAEILLAALSDSVESRGFFNPALVIPFPPDVAQEVTEMLDSLEALLDIFTDTVDGDVLPTNS